MGLLKQGVDTGVGGQAGQGLGVVQHRRGGGRHQELGGRRVGLWSGRDLERGNGC